MYLIIVGASAVSKQLISIIQDQGHKVAIIEKHEERARDLMKQVDVQVFHADITQGNILEEADVKNADGIIATTKDDAINLMTMVLGKHHHVKHLVTLLQEEKHLSMFEKLGVQVLSDPERLIAQKLFSFIDSDK